MKNEYHKIITLEIINHLNELNELLIENNANINPNYFIKNFSNNKADLNTEDLNEFLSAITIFSFQGNKQTIKIKNNANTTNKIIIITFLNTILESLDIEEIEMEVIK